MMELRDFASYVRSCRPYLNSKLHNYQAIPL